MLMPAANDHQIRFQAASLSPSDTRSHLLCVQGRGGQTFSVKGQRANTSGLTVGLPDNIHAAR